jgi:phosphate transport system permease protein
MRVGIASALAVVTSVNMFVSSILILIFQPDFDISQLWEAALLVSAGLIAIVNITSLTGAKRKGLVDLRMKAPKRIVILAADLLFLLVIFALSFTETLHPGFMIVFEDVGAVFSYNLIFPILVVISSIIVLKDVINSTFDYTPKAREVFAFLMIRLSALFTLLLLGAIISTILFKGIWAISWEFLTKPHFRLGQEGGIWTCIEGTFWLVIGAMLVSAPLGIGAAIYINEYSHQVRLNRWISIAVGCLNGVPSVVYGLFGLAFLVTSVGVSLLAGSVILGLMNLPTIILTSQEALKSVPNSLREGSVALGASNWQTIKKVVMPSALPGIITGLIIGVARAAGETAPIMWTAVTFSATPVQKIYGVLPDPFQPVNNLCYHLLNLIYFLGAWDVERNAWGTALVLLALVLGINMLAIVARNHYRKKISW